MNQDKKSDSHKQQIKQEKHQQRQQQLKQQVDDGINKATADKGLLLVITGNGKGKSTSGFGTVARAVGHGLTASVTQFIKGTWDCGERNLLEQHGVSFTVMATGFTWETQNREADMMAAEQAWQQAARDLANPALDVVLLDEITYMLSYHYLDIDEVINAINNRPAHQHVIITGRNCHRRLMDMADTVSEVQSVKHAFDSGIKAQRGIDW
ncbi:cob(I)yrinic acid a,c-diamide adenosyltransferase [Thalassotalea maritima]|uniref:cob(I)yrinic acid a,c-diamide adenosyltransferase n=1 Tax=Thalassotalea maritima TaxID=3242416 RepID=UPI003528CBBB